GDTVNIGSVSFGNGAGTIEIDYTAQTSGYSIGAKYVFPVQYDNQEQAINGTYMKVQPLSYTGVYDSNEVELDAKIVNNVTSLRLRRVAGVVNGTHMLNIKLVT